MGRVSTGTSYPCHRKLRQIRRVSGPQRKNMESRYSVHRRGVTPRDDSTLLVRSTVEKGSSGNSEP